MRPTHEEGYDGRPLCRSLVVSSLYESGAGVSPEPVRSFSDGSNLIVPIVGWAKRSVPTFDPFRVGTLRFAHPTKICSTAQQVALPQRAALTLVRSASRPTAPTTTS